MRAPPILGTLPVTPAGRASSSEPRPDTFKIYPRLGNRISDRRRPLMSGYALMGGGGHVPEAYRWMHKLITGDSKVRGGNILVLRATNDDTYSPALMDAAPFNSVQTVCLPVDSAAFEVAQTVALIGGNTPSAKNFVEAVALFSKENRTAEDVEAGVALLLGENPAYVDGLILSGGQQSRYASETWAPVRLAIARAHKEHGTILGGPSAGAMIWGQPAFIAKGMASNRVTSTQMVAHPRLSEDAFASGLFGDLPLLEGVVIDTHLGKPENEAQGIPAEGRDRIGRMAVMLAARPDAKVALGLGEKAALLLREDGEGRIARADGSPNSVYLMEAEDAFIPQTGALPPTKILVRKISDPSERVDFLHWQNTGNVYNVTVNPSEGELHLGLYSAPPYDGA